MTVQGTRIDDLAGTVLPIGRDRVFTIGRLGDLRLDHNPRLHRRLLTVFWHDRMWWMENVGQWIPVRVSSPAAGLSHILGPGDTMVVNREETRLVFDAGETTYELALFVDLSPRPQPEVAELLDGTTTDGPGALNAEQIQLLLALCEPMLRNAGVSLSAIPSTGEIAERLGWSTAKVGRKLDYLCLKLGEAGVPGLLADGGRPASTRRADLAEWAMATKVVTPADLVAIDRLLTTSH
ncbi:hypothetical protein MYK68_08545 [Gordonia sp. PP30]|uniref:hypothetical protein n=1 Tax=unclassified Gordonia (in: high G+C Gram-positive bacteria) TaxID=2657482 RepID=UPI001FFEBD84|nr:MULTISPECIES: hypothetical protein [unclassified Gordonia (in: high G+C Gram-positive bacteria)]UQE76592.1 hypothetical protein MYK68_08545 [Gordonia sp. PP30]